jgi:hypothetical protein
MARNTGGGAQDRGIAQNPGEGTQVGVALRKSS